jgi:hypothetical protein
VGFCPTDAGKPLVGHADGEYTFERKKAPAKAKAAAKAAS